MTEMTWRQVAEIHGDDPGGIRARNGQVVSLLCNTSGDGPYPNRIEGSRLVYYVGPRTSSEGVHALLMSVDSGQRIRVFEKLAAGRWRDQDYWFVVRVGDRNAEGLLPFILYRSGTAGGTSS